MKGSGVQVPASALAILGVVAGFGVNVWYRSATRAAATACLANWSPTLPEPCGSGEPAERKPNQSLAMP
jgi:hypothetical protein